MNKVIGLLLVGVILIGLGSAVFARTAPGYYAVGACGAAFAARRPESRLFMYYFYVQVFDYGMPVANKVITAAITDLISDKKVYQKLKTGPDGRVRFQMAPGSYKVYVLCDYGEGDWAFTLVSPKFLINESHHPHSTKATEYDILGRPKIGIKIVKPRMVRLSRFKRFQLR